MLRRWACAGALVIIVCGVYWRAADNGFVWDDDVNITENPYLNPVTLPKLLLLWQKPYERLYIPLTYTVWGTLAATTTPPSPGGRQERRVDPRGFHVANLVVHALNAVLVFFILRLLLAHDLAACAGALFFALHPVQVEPVAWITGMKDVLCAFFALVAVWQYLLYAKAAAVPLPTTAAKPAGHRVSHAVRRRLHYGLGLVAFLLALLAKPTAVVVPLILGALDFWLLGRAARKILSALAIWLAAAVLIIAATQMAQPESGAKFIAPLWARPLVASDALVFYLWKLIWPIGLGPDYGRSPEWLLRQPWAYLVWVIPLGLGGLVIHGQRRWPFLAAATAIFAGGVLPVLGLSPFDFQRISTVADRYLYLSMLGPALAVSSLIRQRPSLAAAITAAVVLVTLGLASAFQLRHWRDDRSLFHYALSVNPDSWTAHNNLGNAALKEGELAMAVSHYRRALEIDPGYAKAHNNLGIVQVMGGEVDEAIRHYRRALEIDPEYAKAHNNLGIALAMRAEVDDAIAHFYQALATNPAFLEAHYNVANMLARKGQLGRAIAHYRRALEIDPGYARAHNNLGVALAMRGELQEAVGHFRAALSAEPDSAETHERLARALSLQGNQEEAARHFEEAIRILRARKTGVRERQGTAAVR